MNTMKGQSMPANDLAATHCSTCQQMAKHGCRRMMAAHLLGIGRTTLYRKIKEYDIAC